MTITIQPPRPDSCTCKCYNAPGITRKVSNGSATAITGWLIRWFVQCCRSTTGLPPGVLVPGSTTGLAPRRAITHRYSEHRMANPVVGPVLQINHRVVTRCLVPHSTTGLTPQSAVTHRDREHRMINPVVRPVLRSTTGLTPRCSITHRQSEHRMTNPVVCPVPRSTTGLSPRRAITHRYSEHRMANPVVRPVLRSATGLTAGVLLHTATANTG